MMSMDNWRVRQKKRENLKAVADWDAPGRFKSSKKKRQRQRYLLEALYYWGPCWMVVGRYNTERDRDNRIADLKKSGMLHKMYREIRKRDLKR